MGINSTEVAYNFGQFGSAFTDTAANTITAPEGLAIVAIQCIANVSFSSLVAKDADIWPNTVSAAHDDGNQTIQVNGAVSSSTTIAWDVTTASLGLKVGDEVYLTATGVLLGTIVTLGTSNIVISAAVSIDNDAFVSIVTPNAIASEGTGGQQLASGQVFPKGLTIYGRWDSVSISADDADGGIICYFGA